MTLSLKSKDTPEVTPFKREYIRDTLKRAKPGELVAGEMMGDKPETFRYISSRLTVKEALREFEESAKSETNGKFSALLVRFDDDNTLGIISTGTLADSVISGDFSYDSTIGDICEILYLASEDEDYASMGKNNFGIVDSEGNLIQMNVNPLYTCHAQTNRGNFRSVYICG